MNTQNENTSASNDRALLSMDDLRAELLRRECAEADHPPHYEECTVDGGLERMWCRCGKVAWNRDDRP